MDTQPEDTIVDRFITRYKESPILRMIVASFPLTAVSEAGALAAYEWHRNRRMYVFGSALISLNIDPPEERLKEREFVDAFSATARRVLETTNDRKIRDFASLFATYTKGRTFSSLDHYEEYLSILHDLSVREFQVLLILHKLESENPLKEGENRLGRANRIWERFGMEVQSSTSIPVEELTAVLTRISRTGLYEPITGAFFDYAGGRGYVTPLFLSFVKAVIHV